MKFGLDIHGTITKKPKFFAEFSKRVISNGHEIHIITGSMRTPHLEEELKESGVIFTHFFSISDTLIAEHKKVTLKDKNNPVFDNELWNKSKAKYCDENNIDIHFDDSLEYGKYFTTTLYVRVV